MEQVYEQIFFLIYKGNWRFAELYSLPIGLRNWFAKRFVKQLEEEQEAIKKSS
jgi:hypothetical protein